MHETRMPPKPAGALLLGLAASVLAIEQVSGRIRRRFWTEP
ncbi:hypothetical protein [Enterocloster clostridioformis]|nr:hypothetical protein [Enterocloster clostridioformis]